MLTSRRYSDASIRCLFCSSLVLCRDRVLTFAVCQVKLPELEALKVAELRRMLAERSLPTTGLKVSGSCYTFVCVSVLR